MATSSQSAPTANLAHLKLIERKPQESYAFGEFAPDGLPAEEKQKLVELEPKQTYWMQQGKTTPAHQLMPQYFNGTFLRGAASQHNTNMTPAELRIKERTMRREPYDQVRLGPAICDHNTPRQRELTREQQGLLRTSSVYHHIKLHTTTALLDPKTRESDLKYCPTTMQEGEGKTAGFMRNRHRKKSTVQDDLRDSNTVWWGADDTPFKGSPHVRKALISNTFWTKNLVSYA